VRILTEVFAILLLTTFVADIIDDIIVAVHEFPPPSLFKEDDKKVLASCYCVLYFITVAIRNPQVFLEQISCLARAQLPLF
jgi:hypothetical protein